MDGFRNGPSAYPPNTKIKITGIAGLNNQNGVIVNVQLQKERGNYPVFDLKAIDNNSKLHTILEDYQEWFNDYSMDNDDDDFFF